VLLLAGRSSRSTPSRRALRSDGHVTKPFDSHLLIDRVERLLRPPPEAKAPEAPARPADAVLEAMFDDLASPEAAGIDSAPSAPDAGMDMDDVPRGLPTLSPADIEAIAKVVVERLSDRVIREIAWDVVPDLAEIVVRERIHELERDRRESS
jgi:hypothetical protein